jgi:hypothetical protein
MSMPTRIPGPSPGSSTRGPGTGSGWLFGPLHVGIVVAPGWLLHVERATHTLLARYRDDWRVGKRVLGFWRHRRMPIAG